VLTLKRRREQRIQIGPDVFITVLAISADWVKLRVEAPPELRIRRVSADGEQSGATPAATHERRL
jgi:carbon storage regulator CsrA